MLGEEVTVGVTLAEGVAVAVGDDDVGETIGDVLAVGDVVTVGSW